MQIIKDLKIKDSNYRFLNEDYSKLSNLSRVNIFIGENNSGKSRFLRSLFYKNNSAIEFIPQDKNFNNYLNKVLELNNALINVKTRNKLLRQYRVSYMDLKKYINTDEYARESESHCEKLIELYEKSEKQGNNSYFLFFKDNFEQINFLNPDLFKYKFHKIYIPSLRGLLPFIPEKTILPTSYSQQQPITNFINEDVFGHRIKKDYFGEESEIEVDIKDSIIKTTNTPCNYIITGHYFYKYVQEFLLGNLQQREIIKEYQEYLSKNFFQNQDVTLIPKLEDEVLTVKIGDEEEQKIYDLGEGIQSIILITLPLFLYLDKSKEENTNSLVFIEEPEIGLHPRLQRELLKTFLSPKFENYQIFFTTHSNHFIDRLFKDEDISIYSFNKKIKNEKEKSTKFNIEKVGFDHIPTLKKLGALPSSVLSENCLIMVEGTTDKKHYRLYLKLYQDYHKKLDPDFRTFTEKTHYSFSIGGGSEAINTIKEFTEIEKERIFFIFDNDSTEKTEKKQKLFKELNYTEYHVLKVKEVENLISKDALINIIKNICTVDEKNFNTNFEPEEYYKSKNFHKFIIDTIFNGNKPNDFSKKPVVIKTQLSKSEEKYVTSFEELTDNAKDIAEKIYNFIEKNNPKI